MINNQS